MPDCKFYWMDLPRQIKEKLGETVVWFNLPKQLNDLLEELKLSKPDCYAEVYPEGHKKIMWMNLPSQLTKLCELEDCEE